MVSEMAAAVGGSSGSAEGNEDDRVAGRSSASASVAANSGEVRAVPSRERARDVVIEFAGADDGSADGDGSCKDEATETAALAECAIG